MKKDSLATYTLAGTVPYIFLLSQLGIVGIALGWPFSFAIIIFLYSKLNKKIKLSRRMALNTMIASIYAIIFYIISRTAIILILDNPKSRPAYEILFNIFLLLIGIIAVSILYLFRGLFPEANIKDLPIMPSISDYPRKQQSQNIDEDGANIQN